MASGLEDLQGASRVASTSGISVMSPGEGVKSSNKQKASDHSTRL